MTNPIKYLGSQSAGIAFEEYETRTVNVTSETIVSILEDGNPHPAPYANDIFEGDVVTWSATVKDSAVAVLPATFVAQLDIVDATTGAVLATVVASQAFDSAHYNATTGVLTLSFTVPSGGITGISPNTAYKIALKWATQIIG
jgi:hypothetical protein